MVFSSGASMSVNLGDIAVLAAAVFYALSTVRLSFHASQLGAVRLTGNVIVMSTIFSLGWVLLDVARAVLDGVPKTPPLFTLHVCLAVDLSRDSACG